jgi:hypothetical protein
MQSQQMLYACFVQCHGVPGRISQQVLQPLNRGSCNYVGDGVTRLVRQIGEQPGRVALHALSTRVAAEQRGQRLQEGCQFR